MHTRVGNLGTESHFETAMSQLFAAVKEGLQHGYFHFRIDCEVTTGGKRALVLQVGKIYRYLISEQELPQ